MAQGSEWVQFMLEKMLNYVETPRSIRKQARIVKKSEVEPWQYRWFGMLPVAAEMWMKGIEQKKEKLLFSFRRSK